MMENVRNRTVKKLANNKKDYFKCKSKPSYMLHKIFDNNLAAIGKRKVSLNLTNLHSLECVFWN